MAHPFLWWQGNHCRANGARSDILLSYIKYRKVVNHTYNRGRKSLSLFRQRLVSFGSVVGIYLSISYLTWVLWGLSQLAILVSNCLLAFIIHSSYLITDIMSSIYGGVFCSVILQYPFSFLLSIISVLGHGGSEQVRGPDHMLACQYWLQHVADGQSLLQALLIPATLLPTLLPTPLLEPRYFIIPYVLLRLQIQGANDEESEKEWLCSLLPWIEVLWYLVLNFGTMYIFLYGEQPILGSDSVTRFMWWFSFNHTWYQINRYLLRMLYVDFLNLSFSRFSSLSRLLSGCPFPMHASYNSSMNIHTGRMFLLLLEIMSQEQLLYTEFCS